MVSNIPKIGEDSHFDEHIFSDGLVQPPTSDDELYDNIYQSHGIPMESTHDCRNSSPVKLRKKSEAKKRPSFAQELGQMQQFKHLGSVQRKGKFYGAKNGTSTYSYAINGIYYLHLSYN